VSQAGAGKPDASFEPWKIDLVSISPDGSTVNLYIVAEQPLTGSDGQLRSLQEKIHNYVSYVLDGQMSRELPETCGVKKDRHSDLRVRQLSDPPSHCPDALVHPVPALLWPAPPARPLRPR
jgi:hypothetical protein